MVCLSISAFVLLARPQDGSYRATIEKWRQQHEASLKSDHGWLTVSGLFWLHEGENRFGSSPMNDIVLPEGETPVEAGVFEFHGGKTTVRVNPGVAMTLGGKPVETAEIRPDSDDQLVIGNLTLLVHQSGDRYAIRLRDKNSKLRKDFSGLHWFPIDESYRVTARYVPYDKPKEVAIQNILGDTSHTTVAGCVVFTLRGQEYRLEPEDADSDGMFFVFRDLTSGKETYPAARFLVTPPPKDGAVVLDFNQAYNPPCAYNPYTTCPLPSPENRLKVRIEAGEMAYKHDHSS
ncbi:MAG: DUF1684 domain-containing protein [Candidatus Acidiferrales bacterium]